ncbi:hypothetical protein LTR86_010528 [Recurvomyces mirabilis]|nr:hypothetical protein LTR86_010528 [Recurvomyces mirabilis]
MTTPSSPLVLEPSGWLGNDGNWSTFRITVGEPAQTFDVLPAFGHGEVWLPVPDGCKPYARMPFDCASSRGVVAASAPCSSGFETNLSSSWDLLGIYDLNTDLFVGNETGLYGLDTVSLLPGMSIQKQAVAGITTSDFWLGQIGIAQTQEMYYLLDGPATMTNGLVASLSNYTPSVSFGYTAGASYVSSKGSLVLGGYDQARLTGQALILPLNRSNQSPLSVDVVDIVAANTMSGTISTPLGHTGLPVYIDAGVSQMWLPRTICDLFAEAFGLIYDSDEEIYLINSTAHALLAMDEPQLTFTFAARPPYTGTVNIVLPYAALALPISQPYYNETAMYFPLRRAKTRSVLGQAFLQEAYLIVDWERNNLTLGQVAHEGNATQDIVPILPTPTGPPARAIGGSAVIGMATGCIGVVITIFLAVLFKYKRLRRGPQDDVPEHGKPEVTSGLVMEPRNRTIKQAVEQCDDNEVDQDFMAGPGCHELPSEPVVSMLMSTPVYELPGGRIEYELSSQEPTCQPDCGPN